MQLDAKEQDGMFPFFCKEEIKTKHDITSEGMKVDSEQTLLIITFPPPPPLPLQKSVSTSSLPPFHCGVIDI